MKSPSRRVKDKLKAYVDDNISRRFDVIESRLDSADAHLDSRLDAIYDLLKAEYEDTAQLNRLLVELRKTSQYEQVWNQKKPLVTVRIATYNNVKLLLERAIPSVLAQTYQNFEIIVVGDHCTDDTEEKLATLKDKRITFYNFPYRNVYPEDVKKRWMVAGSPGMNMGAQLARGEWIAPLDDDDEFSKDHIEKLVGAALKDKYEMVYGKLIRKVLPNGEEHDIFSYPPKIGHFSFQGALYLRMMDFFQWDTKSWVVGEPGDWNMCKRMMDAGVRIGAIEDEVGKLYHTLKE